MNDLILGDCLTVMKDIPSETVDLTITSPPYNLGNDHHISTTSGRRTFTPYEDNLPETDYQQNQIAVLDEIWRVTKTTGSLFYNHKNRIKNGRQITPYEWLLKTKWVIKQEIVWFNRSQNFDKIRFYPMTERVYWLTKSTSTKLQNVISHHDLFTTKDWPTRGSSGIHKRAFPEQMVSDLISCFPEAKTVMDPYAGSGTTLVVANRMGKHYVGIERDEQYHRLALQRINDDSNQQNLF